jgi:hypothetical protein
MQNKREEILRVNHLFRVINTHVTMTINCTCVISMQHYHFMQSNFIHKHVKVLRIAVTNFHEHVSPMKSLYRGEQTETTEGNGTIRNLIYNEHFLPTRDNALS